MIFDGLDLELKLNADVKMLRIPDTEHENNEV